MIHLGVNIDHVATLRNARGGLEPDPLTAAELATFGGADSITVHLREDRRHIVDRDVELLKERSHVPINLEMAIDPKIVDIALKIQPSQITLVPEKREEVTTESGLDVIRHQKEISSIAGKFRDKGIVVSLFVDPNPEQLQACLKTGTRCVEIHTGAFANARNQMDITKELNRLTQASFWCMDNDVALHAGHGLNYHNTSELLHLPALKELNIGHSIVSRAVFVGLKQAVRDMREILNQASTHAIIEKTNRLLASR